MAKYVLSVNVLGFDSNEEIEPDSVSVRLDGKPLHESGQRAIPHGPDRDLTVAEALPATYQHERAAIPGG